MFLHSAVARPHRSAACAYRTGARLLEAFDYCRIGCRGTPGTAIGRGAGSSHQQCAADCEHPYVLAAAVSISAVNNVDEETTCVQLEKHNQYQTME